MTTMRLYRGLTKPYRAGEVLKPGQSMTGTDFTDCPFTALKYAQGARGVLLVIDIDADSHRVTEELWLGMSARRFMVWGSFEGLIAGAVQAKELRALVRKKSIVTYDDSAKARILRKAIEERLHDRGRVDASSSTPPPVASDRS